MFQVRLNATQYVGRPVILRNKKIIEHPPVIREMARVIDTHEQASRIAQANPSSSIVRCVFRNGVPVAAADVEMPILSDWNLTHGGRW
jgi:hypothetical protein